ncbi:MAG: DUF58 domain-containing protein [Ruminococcus sp.]|nr:DUF58 domain-containing protein [Ruminococcus sp.]
MIYRIISYLLSIIAAYVFLVIYWGDFPFYLLTFLVIFPVVMLAILIITSFGIKFSVKVNNTGSNKGEFTVIIENKSIFPISSADIRITYYNKFCPKECNMNGLQIPIGGRNTTKATFEIVSSHCGVIVVGVKSIILNDFFKFWRIKRKVKGEKEFICLPEIDEFNLENSLFESENESDNFSQYKAGDDNSEVFDLREYQYGDRINRVHWKLSVKSEDLIIKEYSLPLDTENIVLFDFNMKEFDLKNLSNDDAEMYLKRTDKLFYHFFSLCDSLAENNRLKICSFIDNEYNEFFELNYSYYLNSKPRNAELNSEIHDLITHFKAENALNSFSKIYYVCEEIDEKTKNEVLSLTADTKIIVTNEGFRIYE